MKKRLFSGLLVLAVIASCVGMAFAGSAAQTGKNSVNRYNVVFVTDASGSMTSTDPDEYRFEATNLFLGLMADGGNMVGSVVFNSNVFPNNLIEATGKSDKLAVGSQISGQPTKGWTDIGGALLSAVNMIQSSGKKELPSIIILLSDGNTELGTPSATEASVKNKETALEKAREAGCKIYTICLNESHQANISELKQIANATGGAFREVTKASDLQEVFNLYYQLIYSTQSTQLMNEDIPASGILTREFDVAKLGVEEVNIVIFGDSTKCSLTPPGSNTYSDSELNKISYAGKTFTLLKIIKPQAGNWKLQVYGKPGSAIKVYKIYNSNFQIKALQASNSQACRVGTPVNIIGQIYEGDNRVTNAAQYGSCKATLQIRNFNGDLLATAVPQSTTQDGFLFAYTPTKYGTFYATVTAEDSEQHASSDPLALNVGNTPPVARISVLKKHIYRWPFLLRTDSTIDLSGAAKDNEDTALRYKIVSSTWMNQDYTLNGSKLTINHFSVSDGSFTVQAYDSQGAYCTFEVVVTSTNVGVLAMIILLAGAVLLLAAMLILLKISLGRPFMGKVTAENLETGQSSAYTKSRGRLHLSAFQIGQTGLRGNCYFQATGKNYIYFISKKSYLSDGAVGKVKKVKIISGSDVRIYSDEDRSRGILIRFESMLDGSNCF